MNAHRTRPVLAWAATALFAVVGMLGTGGVANGAARTLNRIEIVGGRSAVSAAVERDLQAFTTTLTRVSGADRYDTAAIASSRYASGPAVTYIATGTDSADALSVAPVAAKAGAPLLLTTPAALPSATKDALRRLLPRAIVVVGGRSAVSDAVVAELQAFTPGTVTRLAGADRYATAAAVAEASFPVGLGTIFIARGDDFADALSGVVAALRSNAPVMLVRPTEVPDATVAALRRLEPRRVIVLGGQSAVSAAVATELSGYARNGVTRLAGADRFATSAAISAATFPESPAPQMVYIASGRDFPDALVAGALIGAPGANQAAPIGPVLLTEPDSLPTSVRAELQRLASPGP